MTHQELPGGDYKGRSVKYWPEIDPERVKEFERCLKIVAEAKWVSAARRSLPLRQEGARPELPARVSHGGRAVSMERGALLPLPEVRGYDVPEEEPREGSGEKRSLGYHVDDRRGR